MPIIYSASKVLEQGGIFIVPYMLPSVYMVYSKETSV